MGKSSVNGQFSIAMLNNQRVNSTLFSVPCTSLNEVLLCLGAAETPRTGGLAQLHLKTSSRLRSNFSPSFSTWLVQRQAMGAMGHYEPLSSTSPVLEADTPRKNMTFVYDVPLQSPPFCIGK